MKRPKFSKEQIIYALRQHEADTPIECVYRQLGVSQAECINALPERGVTPDSGDIGDTFGPVAAHR